MTKFPEFATRFRMACRQKELDDLSQLELAKIFEVSGPMISKYRCGHSLPSMETAILICDITNVNLEWLMRGAGPIRSAKPMTLKELWYSYPPEERLAFLAGLDSNSSK